MMERVKFYHIPLIMIMLFLTCTTEEPIKNNIKQYNVAWDSQSKNSSESMPLVGGDIGCNVWVENGDILFYLQRSGSFDENSQFLKMGRFRVRFDPNPFSDEAMFSQELKLLDGYIQIESKTTSNFVTVKLWIDVFHPVVYIDIQSDEKVKAIISYENWRTENKLLSGNPQKKERFAAFNLEGYPGEVIKTKDNITQDSSGILFYHRNPKEKLIPEILIKEQGLEDSYSVINDDLKDRTFGGFLFGDGFVPDENDEGIYQLTPFKSWKIKSESARKSHQIIIATHIEQAESVEKWEEHLLDILKNAQKNQIKKFKKTVDWWHQFWNRSYIFIQPDNPDPNNPVWQMSRNYQLFRYQLGGNAFSEYPTKFNGGNLVFDPILVNEKTPYDPDWRQWGGSVFTAQNQRLLYWPMLKSGDFDAILSQFELYRKGLPGAMARVKKHFKHEGAVFCEYTSVPGIAMGDGWGWQNEYGYRIRGEEIPFGDPRATAATGFGDVVEKGVMANGSIAYHWESQVEHAFMILEYHRFTSNDISDYMPFIEQSLIFFDQHYRIRQKMRNGAELDEKGKLVIYPSTSCESYRGAKNPTDLISGLKACLTSLLTLDEKYISAEKRKYYQQFLESIPDYSFEEQDGMKVIKPAETWLKESNQELPQFYPLFPFNQFQLGDKEIQYFKNAYEVAPAFRKGNIVSWHQDGIQFARMGMTKEAAAYNTLKLVDSDRRFPTFWGPGHDWVPDHNWGGAGMIGLQEMLMQTIDDKIMLFPSWPKEWNVNFKLHAPKNTIIEGKLKNGKIQSLNVFPKERLEDVVIMLR